MKKINKKQIVIVAALIVLMAVTGTAAYFTATEEAVNTWTVGKVDIDLQEEGYEENKDEETKDITPNQELHKDPKVYNSGKNDAFVFMKVRIPKATVKVANQEGNLPDSATLQELFDYQWNAGWAVVDSKEIKDTKGTYQEYLLVYGTSNECAAVKPGETTSILFANSSASHIANPGVEGLITFKNVIEGQGLENVTLNVDVKSYAIQTDNLTKGDTKSPIRVWNIILNQAGA